MALRAGARHPEAFRSLIIHEPPLFPLLAGLGLGPELEAVQHRVAAVVGLLEAGDHAAAAERFVDTIAFGPGAWKSRLTPDTRATFTFNAPTFLDEVRDPDFVQPDLDALHALDRPVLATSGSESAPFFGPVVDVVAAALPNARREVIEGSGHVPHVSLPERYVALVTGFAAGLPAGTVGERRG